MPAFLNRDYDVRPKRPGWRWMAFALDRVTPIGRGETDTKVEAERAARSCIAEAPARRSNLASGRRDSVGRLAGVLSATGA
jgi:hypothetical protein